MEAEHLVRQRRSFRNPPPGFTRPQARKFYIWQDPLIRYRDGHAAWRWECTFCDPPTHGFRSTRDAFEKIISVSLPRHFRVRYCHHNWVKRNRHA